MVENQLIKYPLRVRVYIVCFKRSFLNSLKKTMKIFCWYQKKYFNSGVLIRQNKTAKQNKQRKQK